MEKSQGSTVHASVVLVGYKQTEVGVIPEDWEIYELGELLESTQLGGNYKNSERETQFPLIKMGNLGRGKINLNKLEFVVDTQSPASSDRLEFGDVLFNTRNTLELVGKISIWRGELYRAYFNSNIMRMKFDNQHISSNQFMNYLLNTDKSLVALRSIAIGTTSVAAIYSRDLVKLKVAIPSKLEQTLIAEALSDADALIEGLEGLIDKKLEVKQGAMQELLTGRRRLDGFGDETPIYKHTEVGMIPEDWDVAHLGQVFQSLDAGVSVNSVEDGSGVSHSYAILKTSCVNGGRFLPSEQKVIAPNDLERARTSPKADTIIFSRMNTPDLVGECGYVPKNYPNLYLPDRLWMTRVGGEKRVVVQWLAYLLSWSPFSAKIKESATGTSGSMKNIAKESLLSVKVPYPEICEQRAISEVLNDIDAEITALEAKLAKARRVKQGMMQELLTGKTRLIENG